LRRLDDPELVREQYETEHALAARKAVYRTPEGPSAHDVAIDAISEVKPRRVLEVGGGEGELAERIMRELGAELVGVDQSPEWWRSSGGKGRSAALRPHFARVERRDVRRWFVMDDGAVLGYTQS
jgi:2-polyprenyl-3-methyl-5-hydroxy-6-metoxy-1,4-benzoquinol methylase